MIKTSVFEKSRIFNQYIGNEPTSDKEKLNTQWVLVQEEFDELEYAIANNDRVELIDGMADVLETLMGLAYLYDVDLENEYNKVFTSNMSKFPQTQEEVEQTKEKYSSLKTRVRGVPDGLAYAVICDEDGVHDGKVFPKGKLLKSINFVSPQEL